MIKLLFCEMRPKQWLKNLVILLPALFANQIFKIDILEKLIFGFLIFSLAASGLYIINDIVDCQKDRLHPEKKNRPIAAGKLSSVVAGLIAAIFIAVSLIGSYYISLNFFVILLSYIALILIYSFYLKRVPVLDMVAIASGFVLRVVAGAFLILVAPSNWIIVTTFFFALFFVATKRRLERRLLEDQFEGDNPTSLGFSPSTRASAKPTFASLRQALAATPFQGVSQRGMKPRSSTDLYSPCGKTAGYHSSNEAKNHRPVLCQYNETFLNILLGVTSTMAIVSYAIYTLNESVISRFGTNALIYTVPFVFIMIGRMLFIAVGNQSTQTSDPTNIVTKDATIYLSAVCWILSVLIIIFFHQLK